MIDFICMQTVVRLDSPTACTSAKALDAAGLQEQKQTRRSGTIVYGRLVLFYS